MPRDLKARLGRIRSTPKEKKSPGLKREGLNWPGWVELGPYILKRVKTAEPVLPKNLNFDDALPILIPDLLRYGRIPGPADLLFFDLETTGLSGGAGTLAFLAAFGRFRDGKLEITQYLLLDYPGESEFVELMVKEMEGSPLIVSYNGKTFDAQILKTRCLMNGIRPPDISHADLLHPSRRLWKSLLPNCSQATIEVSILGLDRTGDIPGSLAPEIWFSFLRGGSNDDLLGICDHNFKDIAGLACIFLTMAEIARKPLESKYRFDEEALALYWNRLLRRNPGLSSLGKTGALLLENSARKGSARAAIVLAIDAEWRLRDPRLALHYVERALAAHELPDRLRDDLEKRHRRLKAKPGG
ncbi:MAG: ribonuclease H-like domain-containing protein [Treponema sp.]|nr:ribonuclease H-like domain-containing protein [Treponema sp.]